MKPQFLLSVPLVSMFFPPIPGSTAPPWPWRDASPPQRWGPRGQGRGHAAAAGAAAGGRDGGAAAPAAAAARGRDVGSAPGHVAPRPLAERGEAQGPWRKQG